MGNPNPIATFNTHVHTVDVFVFDEAGDLAYYRPQIGRESMVVARGGTRSTRPGIDLPVGGALTPGGRYRVVVWGNADHDRQAFDQNQVNNARVRTAPDGGTPLHYGPGTLRGSAADSFWITMPDTVEDSDTTIVFTRAHIEIEVFVAGASDVPRVDLNGVADGISFNKVVSSTPMRFSTPPDEMETGLTPSVPGREQRQAFVTSFYAPVFYANTGKTLEIRNSTGALLPNGNIRISDVIAGITPSNINVGIPARLELANTNVPVERIQIVLEVEQDPQTGDDIVVGVWLPGWIPTQVDPI